MGYIDDASMQEINRLAEELEAVDPQFDMKKYQKLPDIKKKPYIKSFIHTNFEKVNWNYIKKGEGISTKFLLTVKEKNKDVIFFSSHWEDLKKLSPEKRERFILDQLANDPHLLKYKQIKDLSPELITILTDRIIKANQKLIPINFTELLIWKFNEICDRNQGELTQASDFYNGKDYDLFFNIIKIGIERKILKERPSIIPSTELLSLDAPKPSLPIKKFIETLWVFFDEASIYLLSYRFNIDLFDNMFIYYPHPSHPIEYVDVMINPLENRIEFYDQNGLLYITEDLSHKEFLRADFLIDYIVKGQLPRKTDSNRKAFNDALLFLTYKDQKNNAINDFLENIGKK